MTPLSQLSETVLALRWQAGDERAFEQIVQRHHGALKYFVRRLAGDSTVADDIAQEVWLKVFRNQGTLQKPEALRVWIYQIARNEAYQHLRKTKFQPHRLPDKELPDPTESHEEEFSAEDAAQIHRGLERLPLEQREALTLRFLEEMEYQEIAEIVGCSLGTVRSRIYYGKQALRQFMEADHGK